MPVAKEIFTNSLRVKFVSVQQMMQGLCNEWGKSGCVQFMNSGCCYELLHQSVALCVWNPQIAVRAVSYISQTRKSGRVFQLDGFHSSGTGNTLAWEDVMAETQGIQFSQICLQEQGFGEWKILKQNRKKIAPKNIFASLGLKQVPGWRVLESRRNPPLSQEHCWFGVCLPSSVAQGVPTF